MQLETFTKLKDFVDNPRFHEQRQNCLGKLEINTIDAPIVELVEGFAKLPYCFTLQSCYGHFLHGGQKNPNNIEPLPVSDSIACVEYRVAYIALCIDNGNLGRSLFLALNEIPAIEPEYIQIGCAEWFWQRQVNSYALQVEPRRHMTKDRVWVDYQEALHLERTRDRFLAHLKQLVQEQVERSESG